MNRTPFWLPLALLLCSFGVRAPGAQETLERTPNLPAGWVGQTGMLYTNLGTRVWGVDGEHGRELLALPALDLGLGLPHDLLAIGRFAPQSPTVAGHPTEWELLARYRPLAQARGLPADAAGSLAWNGAARSLDAELSLARWFGPLRLVGAVRALGSAFGSDATRMAVAGGGVLHPLPGRVPVALVGDLATVSERRDGEELAWSAGVQLGVSFTSHTLAAFATNTASPTLQGTSRGDRTVRYGLELTVPIAVARFAGWVVPRDAAAEAVVPDPDPADPTVRADMARYLFLPKRLEVAAGTIVEWANRDGVLHTVNSEDGAFRSGPIEPGESWHARFDRPGRYLVYCGPHPFMKAEVIVR